MVRGYSALEALVAMRAGFWEGRRVFLTGHTGFKGGWLSLWLQSLGAEVHGYALAPDTKSNLFEVARVAEGMVSEFGDIRDASRLTAALQRARPEIVIHIAAQPLVRRSYIDPVETYSTNVMGLVNLFEAVRKAGGVRAIVNVTSDKCYENFEWIWGYREHDAMGGHDPYSSSKGCAELVTAAYRRSFFQTGDAAGRPVALASGRAGNVLGGGDWAEDRLVPDLLRALSEGRPAIIRNPRAVRPWQHVLEPLSGYLSLAEHLVTEGEAFAEGWNFGPAARETCAVQEVADRLVAHWGDGASWQGTASGGPHEAGLLALDCTKAQHRLGWMPRWNLDHTIARIVSWQRAYLHGADMRDFTLSQIKAYEFKEI